MTRAVALFLVITLVFAPSASAKPVFDCTKADVRRAYPAQCPELGVPFLLGGGGSGDGDVQCGGLCGIVRDIVGRIPGIGGIL